MSVSEDLISFNVGEFLFIVIGIVMMAFGVIFGFWIDAFIGILFVMYAFLLRIVRLLNKLIE